MRGQRAGNGGPGVACVADALEQGGHRRAAAVRARQFQRAEQRRRGVKAGVLRQEGRDFEFRLLAVAQQAVEFQDRDAADADRGVGLLARQRGRCRMGPPPPPRAVAQPGRRRPWRAARRLRSLSGRRPRSVPPRPAKVGVARGVHSARSPSSSARRLAPTPRPRGRRASGRKYRCSPSGVRTTASPPAHRPRRPPCLAARRRRRPAAPTWRRTSAAAGESVGAPPPARRPPRPRDQTGRRHARRREACRARPRRAWTACRSWASIIVMGPPRRAGQKRAKGPERGSLDPRRTRVRRKDGKWRREVPRFEPPMLNLARPDELTGRTRGPPPSPCHCREGRIPRAAPRNGRPAAGADRASP